MTASDVRQSPAMKLLAVRLDAAGDVLMCTPALRALVASGHQLTLLTSGAGAEVGRRCDAVREVVCYDAPWMKASATCAADSVTTLVDQLARAGFDGAVIFTSYSQSALPAALACQMAGIPLRAAHCRENPYQLLTHWVRETEPATPRHEVQRQLDLVHALGLAWPSELRMPNTAHDTHHAHDASDAHDANDKRLRLRITAAEQWAATQLLRAVGLADDARFVLLHPGASAPSRRYPLRHWRALLPLLAASTGLPLVIAGSAQDLPVVEALLEDGDPACRSVAGHTDLGVLAALAARARVLVACNSAPAHIAAATGTPVVCLYALTNLQHIPWRVESRVLFDPVPCHGCLRSVCPLGHHACLENLRPETVVQAVQELLQDR